MVIGNGLIAKRFESYISDDKVLIFASGVSNSKSTDPEEYERESRLLKEISSAHPRKTLVYFSTCSIEDPSENKSDYVAHKIKIEQFIQTEVESYLIFRVSNLVGRSANLNTVFNFIVHNIREQIHFNLWVNASRNLIDVDDFFHIADQVIKSGSFRNQIVNIANVANYTASEIVAAAENHFDKTAICTLIEKGSNFAIDVRDIDAIIKHQEMAFGDGYLQKLLNKYY